VLSSAIDIKKKILAVLDEGVRQEIFPGAVAGIAWGPPASRREIVAASGSTGSGCYAPVTARTCFDLASLTKPLATTLTILCLLQEKRITLSASLAEVLAGVIPPDKQAITVRSLLSHGAGLPAHRPYFEKLMTLPFEERPSRIRKWLLAEPLSYLPGAKRLYSDLDFMLLGMIIEDVTGQSLDKAVEGRVLRPLNLQEEIFYQPAGKGGRQRVFAATENCPWRRRILRGEVHDDNAHALGGVAGHAGLFGTVGGVLSLACHLLDVRQGVATHPRYHRKDLLEFLADRDNISNSTLLLGFDTPAVAGSSAGRFFSPASIGHLGFTGTSFWIDPEKELVVVLLTNRVHPRRDNERIKAFRPYLHDLIVECLGLAK
jgi:serine-type D-Ala-D-Ala carboxypeptidase